MKTARDIMTHPVLAVRDDWTVRELASFFVEKSISGAPVLDRRRRLTGVVSLSDIVDQVTREREPSERPRRWRGPYNPEDLRGLSIEDGDRLVRDIMTPTFFTVPDDTPLSEIARTMVAGRIHRLLVTRKGHIIGIVTTLDLLEQLAPKSPARRTKPAVTTRRLARLAHLPRAPKSRRRA
ncbi:MAG: CBS domain-containing protein [Thermoanaerobaculia bacterium]|jgi:predicted transcriptional regulator